MPEDDKIRYSDIIEPDDSIERLIKQLGELNKSYETMVNAIRAGADRIVQSLKSASGATNEGRKAIDEAVSSTSRLERAQNELKLAMSDTGRQIAILRAQTSATNRATIEQQKYIRQASTSLDRYNSDLKQLINLYNSLSFTERNSQLGGQILDDISKLKNHVDAINADIKAISQLSAAEQRLAFLRSEDGKRLIELKRQISELTSARKQQKTAIDPLVQAQEKLAKAQSDENVTLKEYILQTQEANRIAQLRAQLNNSAEGSYNRLSAQYRLNKIELDKMSASERNATDRGKALETQTYAIYQEMIRLQEATGNHRLSVGHYQRAWDGLGMSISQVVREMPAVAVSLNTFFLGISNNIPMVVNEINRLKRENEALRAQGKSTVDIMNQIGKSLLSWNTALVALLTVFSMFGEEIIEFVKNLLTARDATITTSEAMTNIATEVEKTSASYGENITKLRQLSKEYQALKLTAEKVDWIQNNKKEWEDWGIAIDNVNEADNLFINQTEAVIEAFKFRAQAAAASRLAAEEYEKALRAQLQLDLLETDPLSQLDIFDFIWAGIGDLSFEGLAEDLQESVESQKKSLTEARDEANETAEAYVNLSKRFQEAMKEIFGNANIRTNIRGNSIGNDNENSRNPRDLTNIINRNQITIQRQYEESITELQNDEYAKRRKAAADQVQDANNKLREMYRRNVEYINNVENKYKELTDSQKEQIRQQQEWITKTIANNLQALSIQLRQIENEQQVNSLRLERSATGQIEIDTGRFAVHNNQAIVTPQIGITSDTSSIEQSLAEERDLMERNLELEYFLVLDTNKKLLEAGDEHARSEEEILIELNKERIKLWSEYDQTILSMRQANIENQLSLVKKGSDEELRLLLEQNENNRSLALAQNAAAPPEQQMDSASINAAFNKQGSLIRGDFYSNQLKQQQALDKAIFNEVERHEYEVTNFKLLQERERWIALINLAKSGALDWSDLQIEAAEAAVKGINAQLSKVGIDTDTKSTDTDLSGGFKGFVSRVGDEGLGYSLLESMGFSEDQIESMNEWTDIIIENINDILDAELEAAEQAIEAADKRVDAAQKAYDAEVEARNNGYANNVATAKKELEQEKKNQQQKQKQLEEAQKRQEAINSVTQASSLITASANLWSSFSSIPIVGPALALAAIATMWASFTVAKIKAKQVTANASEEYGEGGLEFLEGGSHASGNDIDLHTKNSKHKNMRAEGGEALAIINKHKTRKYRKILPDVIDSFNKGTFEDKYLNAFVNSDKQNIIFNTNSDNSIDLSRIENDVRSIKKQNEIRYYTMPNGITIIQRKNVKRIIKN